MSLLRPVLLIDDDHEDLFFAKRLLAKSGVRSPIVTIDEPQEGIAFLNASTLAGAEALLPQIVFCDLKMPGSDGLAVLRWAKTHGMLEKVTFAILAGRDSPDDRKRALQSGAHHFLVKFPSVDALHQIVSTAGVVAATAR